MEKYNYYDEMLTDFRIFWNKYDNLIPEKAKNAFIKACDIIRDEKEKEKGD